MKRWATAAELKEIFPEKWADKRTGYVQGHMNWAVNNGRIQRRVGVRRGDQVYKVRAPKGNMSVLEYYVPDVRRWINSIPQRKVWA